MKKRNKYTFEEMATMLPVMDEEAQRRILGGTAPTPTSTGTPTLSSEDDPFAIPGVSPSSPISATADVSDGLTTTPTTGTTSMPPTVSSAVPTETSTTSSCCDSDLSSSTASPAMEASTEQALSPFIIITLPTSSDGEDLPVCMPTGEPFEEFMNTYMPDLAELFGMAGDSFEGVTINVERFLYTDEATISSYTATTSANSVEMQTGYFMEPAWDLTQSMVEGSDRAIYPGEYMVSPYQSAKFKDNYILEDVPGRSYILIHRGRWPENTSGCLLPGKDYSENQILKGKEAYGELNAFLKERGGDGIRIIINNR